MILGGRHGFLLDASKNLPRHIDLHVFIVPIKLWSNKYHEQRNAAVLASVSAGFIRIPSRTCLHNIRKSISTQLHKEAVPESFTFLRNTGRCLAIINHLQEVLLTAEDFTSVSSNSELLLLPRISKDDLQTIKQQQQVRRLSFLDSIDDSVFERISNDESPITINNNIAILNTNQHGNSRVKHANISLKNVHDSSREDKGIGENDVNEGSKSEFQFSAFNQDTNQQMPHTGEVKKQVEEKNVEKIGENMDNKRKERKSSFTNHDCIDVAENKQTSEAQKVKKRNQEKGIHKNSINHGIYEVPNNDDTSNMTNKKQAVATEDDNTRNKIELRNNQGRLEESYIEENEKCFNNGTSWKEQFLLEKKKTKKLRKDMSESKKQIEDLYYRRIIRCSLDENNHMVRTGKLETPALNEDSQEVKIIRLQAEIEELSVRYKNTKKQLAEEILAKREVEEELKHVRVADSEVEYSLQVTLN